MELRDVEAVLLDMDGTLVDSDAAVERAWTVWAGEHGLDPAIALADVHGSPAASTVRRLLPDLDDAAVSVSAARQLALQYDDLADVLALAGAHELVTTIERLELKWAVVTSADVRLATARLNAAGLHPPIVVTSEDVTTGKPDPEGFVEACARLGVQPSHCLVVEDSAPGVAAGRAAGAMVAALKGLAGDVVLDDLHQLAELLEQSRR